MQTFLYQKTLFQQIYQAYTYRATKKYLDHLNSSIGNNTETKRKLLGKEAEDISIVWSFKNLNRSMIYWSTVYYISFSIRLSSDIIDSISLNKFKKKLEDHYLTRNIVFDPDHDFLNTYILSTLLKWLFAIVSFKFIFASWYSSTLVFLVFVFNRLFGILL